MRMRVPIQRYFFLKESRIKIFLCWENAVYAARINRKMRQPLMRAQVPQKKLVYRAES